MSALGFSSFLFSNVFTQGHDISMDLAAARSWYDSFTLAFHSKDFLNFL